MFRSASVIPGHRSEVFAYTDSGSVVGELAVLFRAPRAATVKAGVRAAFEGSEFQICLVGFSLKVANTKKKRLQFFSVFGLRKVARGFCDRISSPPSFCVFGLSEGSGRVSWRRVRQARSDAVLWSVDRRSFEACGGRSEGSLARRGGAGAVVSARLPGG